MSTETINFVGVAFYLVIMLVIGIYASERIGSARCRFSGASNKRPECPGV